MNSYLTSRSILLLIIYSITSLAATSNEYFPRGTIKVLDRTLNREFAVVGATIEITSHGKEYRTTTDSLGSFGFPKLKGQWATYRLKWQTADNAFHIRTDAIGQAYLEGPRGSSQWNTVIRDGEQQFYATIFRAGMAYLNSDWVSTNNRFQEISIKAYFDRKPAGKGSARHNALFQSLQLWGRSKTDKPLSDVRIYSYVAHELGHAHHDQFFHGGSQHLKTTLRLKESWAEACRYFLTRDMYGTNREEVKVYSKQHPFFSGWKNFKWERRKKYYANYTPFMIDLVDTLDQDHLKDRVSGYTMQQIQLAMEQPDCRDLADLARILKGRYNNPTEIYLDELLSEMEEK